MMRSPLKTSSPRSFVPKSTNSVQRSSYIVSGQMGSRYLVSPTDTLSPVEPAETSSSSRSFVQQIDWKSSASVLSHHVSPRHVAMATNGKSQASAAVLRDVPFVKACKAAYLGVKNSIADEIVTPQELTRALQQAGFNPSKKKIMRYWKRSNEDGLTFARFCDIADTERSVDHPDLLKAFRKLDNDDTGFVACEKLKVLMTTRGEEMSETEFDEVFRQSPFWTNERFNYLAFCEDMKRTIRTCWTVGVETLSQQERQYELNCNTYVIKRKAERDRAKRESENRASTIGQTNGNSESSAIISKDWSMCRSKGCFYVDAASGKVRSHQFILKLESATNVRLSMETLESKRRYFALDMVVYVIREGDHTCRQLIAVTDQKDENGAVYFQAKLEAGNYVLMPFTSGRPTNIKLKSFGFDGTPRSTVSGEDPKQLVLRQYYYHGQDLFSGITPEYRDALEEMFTLLDLDGNGRLSRHEFALFQMHAYDEEITDLDWQTLIRSFESESGEITLNGFLAIHKMEVEHGKGNVGELWHTLKTLGFNEQLEMASAYPYMLQVHTEEPNSKIHACACKCGGSLLEKAICRAAIERGQATKVRNLNDLISNKYITGHFATIIVQNKSHSPVMVRLDCKSSKNCRSHRETLDFNLTVPPKSAMIGHHLVKIVDKEKWEINCIESVIK